MSENRNIQNTNTTRRNIRVFESFTTTDATPTVIAWVPLGEGRASFFEAKVCAVASDFSGLQAITTQAGFRRPTGGNVTRATSSGGAGLPYTASSGDFTGTSPKLDLEADTVNQRINLVATGKTGVSIVWHFVTLSIQNL